MQRREVEFCMNYIPIVITASNVLLGIICLLAISAGRFNIVFPIILVTALFDFTDGYLARKLKAETRAGCVLDSVADLVCFVFVPSIYIFAIHKGHAEILLTLACIFYLLTGAARLIRYTVSKLGSGSKSGFFSGCPVTGAALCVVMSAGISDNIAFQTALLFTCAFLMVVRIEYRSLSKILDEHIKDLFFLIYGLLVLPLFFFYPTKVTFAFSLAYLMFFPLNFLRLKVRQSNLCSCIMNTGLNLKNRFSADRITSADRLVDGLPAKKIHRLPIAKDTRCLVTVCALFSLTSIFFLPAALKITYLGIFLALAFFFRDPERISDELDDKKIVAPADGRIVAVEKVFSEDTKSFSNRISIFLSIFNIHVNRAPVKLHILKCEHRDGGNLDARNPMAVENEHNLFTCEFADGKIFLLKQIAGKFARRVISYVSEGDELKTGERFGTILFGSRVDIFLPEDTEIIVKNGDTVRAGKTKIAVCK